MAGSEIIDSLVTQLEYTADTKVLKEAKVELDKLEKQSKETAKATDELADKQLELKSKLHVVKENEQALRAEHKRITEEIKKQGKATEEQRRQLELLEIQLQGNARAAQQYQNELRKAGIEQAKLARQAKQQAAEQRQLSGAMRRNEQNQNTRERDLLKQFNSARGDRRAKFGDFSVKASPIPEPPPTLAARFAAVSAALGPIAAGLAAAATAAAGFFAATAKVVEVGAHMESLRARLKTVEGGTVQAAEAFGLLQKFAATTPFELDEVTTAYIRLKSLGLQPTEQSLKAFGNIAAAQGKTILEFTEAVADAATGEFERLKEFGIKASSQGEQVAISFGGVTTRIKKDSREITALLQKLGEEKFAGAMTDQMGTFAGMLSNLQDAWTAFLDQIAQLGVLDEVKLLLKEIGGVMGDDIAKVIAEVLIGVLQWLRETFVELRDGGGGLGEQFKSLASILELLGMVLTPFLALWKATVGILQGAISAFGKVADVVNTVWEALGNLLGVLDDVTGEWPLLTSAWEKAKSVGSSLADTANNVTASLWGQTDAMSKIIDQVETLQGMLGVADITKVTDEKLQEMRRKGGAEAEKADAEIRRRFAERATSEGESGDISESIDVLVAESNKKRAGQAYKDQQAKRAGEVAKRGLDELSDKQLQSFIDDPNINEKLKEKARQEQERRSDKKRKGGAKAAKKMHDATLAADVQKQLETTARKLAQRDAATALQRGQIKPGELASFETARYKERLSKMETRFAETGQLPAGIMNDLRQVQRLPNEADLAGRVAPPVISVTNNRFEINGNTFVAEVTGQFAQSPSQVAQLALPEFRRGLMTIFGESVPSMASQVQR